ncbi:MAG: IS200/IS605 family transposase [Balneolaceae bacterium]|nr:MAG: IS200/IS605 family transposase [Balneolaceae bacterium]
MEKTYSRIYIHFFFGTKNSQKLIKPEIEKRLWSYIGAIGKRMGVKPIAIGGHQDHLHLLLSVPPNLSVSFIMQKLKASSSKWMNDTFYQQPRKFRWQPGYYAFSVGYSQKQRVVDYIRNQKQRHKTISFEEECRMFLDRHQVELKKTQPVKMVEKTKTGT